MSGRRLALAAALAAWLLAPLAGWATTTSYVLGTGDKLRITVYGQEDLSGDFDVGASGSLSLPLIGEVPAAGLTQRELESSIVARLMDGYLIDPRVSVEVTGYRPFYIIGGVKSPGSYAYVSGMTVLNAIALAGGYIVTEEENARLRLDLTRARESLDLLRGDYWSAVAREARLIAERDGLEAIPFPEALLAHRGDPKVAEMIEGERHLLRARREALRGEIGVLERQVSQYREEIAALDAQMEADANELEIVHAQIADVQKLLDKGFARKTQLTDLQRTAVKIEGDRLEHLANIAAAEQKIGEADLRIINSRTAFLNRVVDDLQEVQKQISDLEKRLQAAREVLAETQLKIGQLSAGLQAKADSAIMITRATGEGSEEFEATEQTMVFPGDIVRIPVMFGQYRFSEPAVD